MEIIRTDSSIIVRDYATDAVGNYAAIARSAAEKAYPLLQEALTVWGSNHAGHALQGLANMAALLPELHDELYNIAEEYSLSDKGVVRKAAKDLTKALEMKPSRSID